MFPYSKPASVFLPSFNHSPKGTASFVAKRAECFNKHGLSGSGSTRSFRGYKQQEQGGREGACCEVP